jgi:S-adenosylmethionine synthetase
MQLQRSTSAVQVLLEDGCSLDKITRQAEAICQEELARIGDFCMELARGEHPVC